MPSLMRFLSVLATIAAVGFGTLYALATFVSPKTREITVTIPSQRLKAAPAEAAAKNPKTAGADAGTSAANP